MTYQDYDQLLEEYLQAKGPARKAMEKSNPSERENLLSDAAVVARLEALAKTASPSRDGLRRSLVIEESHKTQVSRWRFQPFGIAVGGVAVAMLVFGSVIVLRRTPTTTTVPTANVSASGSIANANSQVTADALTEQNLATSDDMATTQLDNQINLASQHQTTLGDIYDAAAQ